MNDAPYPSIAEPNAENAAYLETIYARFLNDPASVPEFWREYFHSFGRHPPSLARPAPDRPEAAPGAEKQAAVLRLINSYRVRGHQRAETDPLGAAEREEVPDLDPEFHGLRESDLDIVYHTGSLAAGPQMPLRDILALLRSVYTGPVGAEYMHITATEEKRWIQAHLEPTEGRFTLPPERRIAVLRQLTAAEGIERYLHERYVGQKRFSLEGGESLIPMLAETVQHAGAGEVREIVIGMAHRGRLNVLVNILGKSPAELFSEFEGKTGPAAPELSGDVKYHQGFSCDLETPGGTTHIALAFNPSHLEIVSPVVEGSVAARQHRRGDRDRNQVLPVLLHGDAAFAGQGVVMETFNMSQSRGYRTGGTLHIVINNQIGFTTSNPTDARSTAYCTEVAKMVQAPIFHVNGDSPDAVVWITRLALDYRMRFRKDVVIDLVCYRRHGHNEADEPTVTQPLMYQRIRGRPTTRVLYANELQASQLVTTDEAQAMVEDYRARLDRGEIVADGVATGVMNPYSVDWSKYRGAHWDQPAETGVPLAKLHELGERLLELPAGFQLHPRVAKILGDRRAMLSGDLPLDWGMAETLAYATLLNDGHAVRLSGQDSERGTFFHRHAVLHDPETGAQHTPLRRFAADQPRFDVFNSLLSEEAVLAFEYGYATAEPETLVIWEAQFGDFANGAQVVIDQFISSGEAKWNRLCGLTLFLPHGYEGQGPEHSSARLERYLQLCANENIQVCVPTTPGQMFHLLRRQMVRPFRRPLVVMTPKSLLRHKLSASPLAELEAGRFRPVIPDAAAGAPSRVERMVLCAGKVYFDLVEERRRLEEARVAVVRVEQLYPFPRAFLLDELARYPRAHEVVWCQEEPRNQGAWYAIEHHLRAVLRQDQKLEYAGRPPSSSPASGYYSMHLKQQSQLVAEALTLPAFA
jgi:2-oxoglutarate dehydrogenase E1 component